MRVTIILDSGGFLIDEKTGKGPLDVGYFETAGHDIEVSEDDKPAQPLTNVKLGKQNETIDVEHLDAGGSVTRGVIRSASFKRDLLRKDELYPTDAPDFLATEYDCILRFHSGVFESFDVRTRVFKEHRLSDDAPTGKTDPTREIANDVLVHFDLEKGHELRLRRSDGTNLWSSSSVSSGAGKVSVKLRADGSLDTKYFRKALRHRGPHYRLPNPDPPPMNGNDPGAGGG